jgi:hypothetical protein
MRSTTYVRTPPSNNPAAPLAWAASDPLPPPTPLPQQENRVPRPAPDPTHCNTCCCSLCSIIDHLPLSMYVTVQGTPACHKNSHKTMVISAILYHRLHKMVPESPV